MTDQNELIEAFFLGYIDLRYVALEIEKCAQSRLSCPVRHVMNEAVKYIVIS